MVKAQIKKKLFSLIHKHSRSKRLRNIYLTIKQLKYNKNQKSKEKKST